MTTFKRSVLAVAMILACGLANAGSKSATIAVSLTIVPICRTLSVTPLNVNSRHRDRREGRSEQGNGRDANSDDAIEITTDCDGADFNCSFDREKTSGNRLRAEECDRGRGRHIDRGRGPIERQGEIEVRGDKVDRGRARTGSEVMETVYGQVPSGQTGPGITSSDTLTVTLTF